MTENVLSALRLLDDCEKGNHILKKMMEVSAGPDGMFSNVVRWCIICGAVVVDQEVDGRRCGSVIPIKGSTTTKFLIHKIRKGLQEFKQELKNIKASELGLGGLTDEENIPMSVQIETFNRNLMAIVERNPALRSMAKILGLSEEEIWEINKEI